MRLYWVGVLLILGGILLLTLKKAPLQRRLGVHENDSPWSRTVDRTFRLDSIRERDAEWTKAAERELNALRSVIHGFYLRKERLPEPLSELLGEPDFREEWLQDPWGQPYRCELNAARQEVAVSTSGPDRIGNTGDDLIKTVSFGGGPPHMRP